MAAAPICHRKRLIRNCSIDLVQNIKRSVKCRSVCLYEGSEGVWDQAGAGTRAGCGQCAARNTCTCTPYACSAGQGSAGMVGDHPTLHLTLEHVRQTYAAGTPASIARK